MTKLYSPDEAAARLRICTKLLRRLRQRGDIRYIAITERKVMYREDDLAEYLESRARKAEPCPSTSQRAHSTITSRRPNVVAFSKQMEDIRGRNR